MMHFGSLTKDDGPNLQTRIQKICDMTTALVESDGIIELAAGDENESKKGGRVLGRLLTSSYLISLSMTKQLGTGGLGAASTLYTMILFDPDCSKRMQQCSSIADFLSSLEMPLQALVLLKGSLNSYIDKGSDKAVAWLESYLNGSSNVQVSTPVPNKEKSSPKAAEFEEKPIQGDSESNDG